MGRPSLLALAVITLAVGAAVGQPPGPLPPLAPPAAPGAYTPGSPQAPTMNPGANAPGSPLRPGSPQAPGSLQAPGVQAFVAPPPAALPRPEGLVPLDTGAVTARRDRGGWQVTAGPRVLKDTGDDEAAAREVVRAVRELRPTAWAAIGSPRPVVEYGLTDGRPSPVAAFPRHVVPLDLASARVESVRGVWCLRDDANLVLNFGRHKGDADQALAVARKYGFNRVGTAGGPAHAPALTYFFAGPPADPGSRPPVNPLAFAAQEQALTRTGVPVPGLGFVGESLRLDPRKVEARRAGGEWVLAHGADVIARFGAGEWNARDAARMVQEGRYTEYCTVCPGVSFFLANGRPPARVPLGRVGRAFDPRTLAVKKFGDRWAVAEADPRTGADRPLFDVADAAEGEAVVRVIRHHKFDQFCQAGGGGLTFLAWSGRAGGREGDRQNTMRQR